MSHRGRKSSQQNSHASQASIPSYSDRSSDKSSLPSLDHRDMFKLHSLTTLFDKQKQRNELQHKRKLALASGLVAKHHIHSPRQESRESDDSDTSSLNNEDIVKFISGRGRSRHYDKDEAISALKSKNDKFLERYRSEKKENERLLKEFREYRHEKRKELEEMYRREETRLREYCELTKKKEEWLYIQVSGSHSKDYRLSVFRDIWQKNLMAKEKYYFFKHINSGSGVGKSIIFRDLDERTRELVTRHLVPEMLKKHRFRDEEEEGEIGEIRESGEVNKDYLYLLDGLELTGHQMSNRDQIVDNIQGHVERNAIHVVV